MTQVKKYIINSKTMALIPHFIVGSGMRCTKVLEEDRIIVVEQYPVDIVKFSMLQYGSSYEGARHAAKFHYPVKQLIPFKVCGELDIFMFPTKHLKHPDCIWFSLHHIVNLTEAHKGTVVSFLNGCKLEVQLPLGKMERQYHLTNMLRTRLANVVKGKMHYFTTGYKHGLRLYKEQTNDLNYKLIPQNKLDK